MPVTHRYAWSYLAALALTILLAAISSVPGCSAAGLLLAPGMFLAAVPFREGIHSGSGMTYLVLAGLLDAFVFSWPVMLFWIVAARSHRANRNLSEPGNRI
jgi:hypothetical protein